MQNGGRQGFDTPSHMASSIRDGDVTIIVRPLSVSSPTPGATSLETLCVTSGWLRFVTRVHGER
jgi:hypothetical protein